MATRRERRAWNARRDDGKCAARHSPSQRYPCHAASFPRKRQSSGGTRRQGWPGGAGDGMAVEFSPLVPPAPLGRTARWIGGTTLQDLAPSTLRFMNRCHPPHTPTPLVPSAPRFKNRAHPPPGRETLTLVNQKQELSVGRLGIAKPFVAPLHGRHYVAPII
jgi:hypothetical protein